jgi:hypothetical protein
MGDLEKRVAELERKVEELEKRIEGSTTVDDARQIQWNHPTKD